MLQATQRVTPDSVLQIYGVTILRVSQNTRSSLFPLSPAREPGE